MPTVTINRKVFEKLAGKKLPEDKLKERISFLGTALESITDTDIVVEIFPNRPDMLSEQGFARAFSSFIGVNTGLREYKVNKSQYKVIVEPSVKDVRPYTACAVVKNLKFDDEKIKEIIQIQEKLHVTYGRNRKKVAIGVYPFEKIKPPIRFIAKKPAEIKFRPLEYPAELTGLQILSKHPTGREYGHLLEGKDKFPIFVDADEQVLSMPPIINSHNIGKITESTKDVFVECSGFDYGVLARCLNMIVAALADMGGEIFSVEIDFQSDKKKIISPNMEPSEMPIELSYVNQRLGLDIKDKDLKPLLEKMGHGYSKGKALVPSYRADILHPIDLVEDIAIAYGYENIPEEIPKVATVGEESEFEKFARKISEMLVGLGMIECKTYHITNKDIQTTLMNHDIEVIELANALNQEYNVLQAWAIPSLMQVLKNNRQHEYPQHIFSVGRVFKKDKSTDTGILEQERLACLLCGEQSDYTRIRQVLDYIFNMLGMKYTVEPVSHNSFIPGRVGRVVCEGKKVAYIGEINPQVLQNFDMNMPVAALELNLTELLSLFDKK